MLFQGKMSCLDLPLLASPPPLSMPLFFPFFSVPDKKTPCALLTQKGGLNIAPHLSCRFCVSLPSGDWQQTVRTANLRTKQESEQRREVSALAQVHLYFNSMWPCGGKGRFWKQFYLSSILSIKLSNVAC